MGDRTNFHFKVGDSTLTLYSHWGGYTRKRELAAALTAAMPRIQMGDTAYALRICVSQLIGPAWAEETGFGLILNNQEIYEEEHGLLEIDLNTLTVNDDGMVKSIEDFINYYNTPVLINEGIAR